MRGPHLPLFLLVSFLVLFSGSASAQIIRRPPATPPGQPAQEMPDRPRLFGPREAPPGPKTPTPAQPRPAEPAVDYIPQLMKAVSRWEVAVPTSAVAFEKIDAEQIVRLGLDMERWASEVALYDSESPPAQLLKTVGQLLDLKAKVDAKLKATLELRGDFASLVTATTGRDTARNYLRATSGLIDLSGRMRYLLNDMFEDLAGEWADKPVPREQYIALLCDKRSSVGAEVMALVLTDPGPNAGVGVKPVSPTAKSKLLKLIADTGQAELLPEIVRLLRDPKTSAGLLLQAAETIRSVGLPQDPRPDQDPTLPKPAITAKELLAIVNRIPLSPADAPSVQRQKELLGWLSKRMREGVTENSFRMSGYDVQPGDWLLMRNPSPYNLFTDLSPGLFTHVGVVAAETGKDGLRRMVLVDLPERGSSMPATNVEIFVERTRHYVFLRHPDPTAAKKMGDAAAAVIDNPALFDLNFRTDRVAELKGQPLKGQKVNTYCAGFLLLCAQETSVARAELFPVPEFPAGGKFLANLKEFGMSIGEQFISPTGALFSRKLAIVGTREPMYDPRREIEEAVFNHFAQRMEERTLLASQDAFQALRQRMAEASKNDPALAKALAQAANVNAEMDLVAAAKAAALIEALDEVAYGSSAEFTAAYDSITAGPPTKELLARLSKDQQEKLRINRALHAEICKEWDAEKVTPRGVRYSLVQYYSQQGRGQLDQRFFQTGKSVLAPGGK